MTNSLVSKERPQFEIRDSKYDFESEDYHNARMDRACPAVPVFILTCFFLNPWAA
jgi:hypothetical protein